MSTSEDLTNSQNQYFSSDHHTSKKTSTGKRHIQRATQTVALTEETQNTS